MKCIAFSAATWAALVLAAVVVVSGYLMYRDLKAVTQMVDELRRDVVAMERVEVSGAGRENPGDSDDEVDEVDEDYEEEDEEAQSSAGGSADDRAGSGVGTDDRTVAVLSAVIPGHVRKPSSPRVLITEDDDDAPEE